MTTSTTTTQTELDAKFQRMADAEHREYLATKDEPIFIDGMDSIELEDATDLEEMLAILMGDEFEPDLGD